MGSFKAEFAPVPLDQYFAVTQDLARLALRPKVGKLNLSGFFRVCYESRPMIVGAKEDLFS
jgi:hypothetical protein